MAEKTFCFDSTRLVNWNPPKRKRAKTLMVEPFSGGCCWRYSKPSTFSKDLSYKACKTVEGFSAGEKFSQTLHPQPFHS